MRGRRWCTCLAPRVHTYSKLPVWRACMQDGELLVVDPSLKEEAAAAGTLTVVVNTHSDLCSLNKTSGAGISITQACARARILCGLVPALCRSREYAVESADPNRRPGKACFTCCTYWGGGAIRMQCA